MAVTRKRRQHRPDKSEIGSVVYFVLAAEAKRIKIGTSSGETLERRMSSLLASSPVHLVLLGAIRGGISVERWCHYHCFEHRSHFEWFHWTPRVEAFVRLVLGHGEFAAEQMCGKYYRRDRAGHTHYGHLPPLPARNGYPSGYKSWVDEIGVVPIGACNCELCRAYQEDAAR